MRGVTETFGAITFVNALPTGVGAAAAVRIPVRVDATFVDDRERASATVSVVRGSLTPLVDRSARAALRRYADARARVRLDIDSEVPEAQGLKSSSAVSTAIIGAVAKAAGSRPGPTEIAGLSADVCQEVGLSATGAFDDAFASVAGTAAVTNNTVRRVLRPLEIPDGLSVVLWNPGGTHPPSPSARERFRSRADEGQGAVDAILSGDPFEAMRRNTELVERAMGYRYRELRERLDAAGAIASGVSGLGPTLAIVAPIDVAERVQDALPPTHAFRRTVSFCGFPVPARGGP